MSLHNISGLCRVLTVIPVYPALILWLTGDFKHFFSQGMIQLIYLTTIYQPRMMESLNFVSSSSLAQSLIYASSAALLYSVIILYFICTSLENAYERVYLGEKAKDEFDRQKTFLLGFSHELRNLLNSLNGNVKLASLEENTAKTKEFLNNATLCGELLLHLVNNILDTGKAEIGDLEVNPVPTNIYDTVEKAWHICSEIIKKKDLRGTLKISRNVPTTLKIDHYRLVQVFLNLVGNAVKFTEGGSIDIAVECLGRFDTVEEECFEPYPFDTKDEFNEGLFEKNQRMSIFDKKSILLTMNNKKVDQLLIDPHLQVKQGVLKITVSDTGCGMTEQGIERLFQKFSQVNSDISKRKLGTGLGLFITKQICEKMAGTIKAYSKEDKGSCFTVCIPVESVITNALQISARKDIKNVNRQTRKLQAIVVDDDRLSSQIMKYFLNKLHVDVLGVEENGQKGYKKFLEHSQTSHGSCIITMDLEMPILDGKRAAELIREYERENRLEPCLLIVISGNCGKSEIAECLNVNGKIRADAFLKKPASIDDLAKVISTRYGESL